MYFNKGGKIIKLVSSLLLIFVQITHHRNSTDHISLFTFSRHDAETSEFTVTLQVCEVTQRNTPKLTSTQRLDDGATLQAAVGYF